MSDDVGTVDIDDPRALAKRLLGPVQRLSEGQFMLTAATAKDFEALAELLGHIADGRATVTYGVDE